MVLRDYTMHSLEQYWVSIALNDFIGFLSGNRGPKEPHCTSVLCTTDPASKPSTASLATTWSSLEIHTVETEADPSLSAPASATTSLKRTHCTQYSAPQTLYQNPQLHHWQPHDPVQHCQLPGHFLHLEFESNLGPLPKYHHLGHFRFPSNPRLRYIATLAHDSRTPTCDQNGQTWFLARGHNALPSFSSQHSQH